MSDYQLCLSLTCLVIQLFIVSDIQVICRLSVAIKWKVSITRHVKPCYAALKNIFSGPNIEI
jgi:hypothetical protein